MRKLALAVVVMFVAGLWGAVPGRSAVAYGPQQTVQIAKDISDPLTMDPNLCYEESCIIADLQMYSTLVKFPVGALTQVRPSVASSWDASKDGQTFTFHLRHGIKFASGNQLTADDVLYSFKRVVSLPKNPASWLITQMGIDDKSLGTAVTAPDPYTVLIKMPTAFSPGAFLSIMANPVSSIVDSKTVQAHVQNNDYGSAWLADHSAGSGPFQLAQWERQVTIDLVANPNYNLGPAPAIKRVVMQNIMENTVQQDALNRGDADLAWNLSSQQLAQLKSSPRFYVVSVPNLAMEYLGMDVKNVPAFGKPQVLQAVKYAIDYDGIIRDLLAGNGTPLQGVIPKGLFGYEPSLPFTHDVAKAKQLLSEAGFAGGFNVELLIGTGIEPGGVSASDLGSKIKNDLAAVGIRVDVRALAVSEKLGLYRAQKSQMILQNWFVDYPDADDFAKPFADYTQKSLAWRLQFYNDPLSHLAQQAGGMTNTPQRAALYKQINDGMAQNGPFAMLYQPALSFGASKRLQNLAIDPVNFFDFTRLTKQ